MTTISTTNNNYYTNQKVNSTIMRCPNNCGQRVEFEHMEQHLQQACIKQIIPCSLSNYGCKWKGPREQLNLHLQGDCTYANIVQICMAQVQDQIMQLDTMCTNLKKACEQKDLFIQQLLSEQQQLTQQVQSLRADLERAATANAGATSASTFASLFGNDSLSPLTPLLTPSNASPQVTKSMIAMESFLGTDIGLSSIGTSLISNGSVDESERRVSVSSSSRNDNSSRGGSPSSISIPVEGTGFNIKSSHISNIIDKNTSDSLVQISPRNSMKSTSSSTQAPNISALSTSSVSQLDAARVSSSSLHSGKFFLLAGGGVGSIKAWDTDTAIKNAISGQVTYLEEDTFVQSLKGHTRFVSALHSQDGYICSGSGDTSIRLWDFSKGECQSVLHGCEGKVGTLCTHATFLASGSKDGTTNHKIRLWNLEKKQCAQVLHGHTDWINVLCSTNDQYLFSGSGDRSVRMWDVEKGKCLLKYENTSFVLSLYYHPEQGLLYCGTYDGMIRVWDMRVPVNQQAGNGGNTGLTKTVKAHQSGVLSLCYSNNMLVSGSKDQTIKLWDFRSTSSVRGGQWFCMSTLYGHTNAVKCLVPYAPNLVASGSYDRTVKLWNISDALSKSSSKGSFTADNGPHDYSAAENGEDTSLLTINTGFKVYSLCTYSKV
jgi:WD40 repeat protein